jgi:hypothetical protein
MARSAAKKKIYLGYALAAVLLFALGFSVSWLMSRQRIVSTSTIQSVQSLQQPIPVQLEVRDQIVPPVYPSKDPEYPLRGNNISYQQVGVLVQHDQDVGSVTDKSDPTLLPLFGRKQATRDRWDYYCASDKFHMMRLPVVYENRDCQDDVGCNEIYNSQKVMVPDYGEKPFIARIYKYRDRTNVLDM